MQKCNKNTREYQKYKNAKKIAKSTKNQTLKNYKNI